MTTAQLEAQRIAEVRQQLDTAEAARLRETGGADFGLMWALDYFGSDLVDGDPKVWEAGMKALRNLTRQQQH